LAHILAHSFASVKLFRTGLIWTDSGFRPRPFGSAGRPL